MTRECSCCPAKAKFEVDGDFACGRHLTVVVKMHCDFPPHNCKVCLVVEQEDQK